jgi:C1A family cysteine protease
MNKKTICILVCTLLVITLIPTASSINKIYTDSSNDNEGYTNECGCQKLNNNNDRSRIDFFDNYVVMDNPPDLSNIGASSPKPIPVDTPSEFSWKNYNGKDWTTPAKNQGNCGSCWAFAAIDVFESMIKIREGEAELNPDLSEQYILSCLPLSGSCHGGNAYYAYNLIKDTTSQGNYCNGVIFESCLEYLANDDIPCSNKCENWEETLVPLLDFGAWQSDGTPSDIKSIKTQIMENGPVVTHFGVTDLFKLWGMETHDSQAYYPKFEKVFGYNHVVMILGWKDVSSIPTGGYWICKNSWGTNWGYNGFFNIAYGALNIDKTTIVWADYDPDGFDWAPLVDTGGSYGGYPNQEITFDASKSIGFEGSIINYFWDFGDGSTGSGVTTTHKYSELGKYTITLTVTDSKNNIASGTTSVWIQESNTAPNKPSIEGTNPGKIRRNYPYTISSTDPEGNDQWYLVDWGDGTQSSWFGPFKSGEKAIISHHWDKLGTYTIKAKTKDVFGDESDWGTLDVTMPRTKTQAKFLFFDLLYKIKNIFRFDIQ